MRFMNPFMVYTFALAVILFAAGFLLNKRLEGKTASKAVLVILLIPALFSLLFPAVFAIRPLGENSWYCTFRTIPGIEMGAALSALAVGFLFGMSNRKKTMLDNKKNRHILFKTIMIIFCAAVTVSPFAKSLLLPVSPKLSKVSVWKNGQCMQTCSSTCGPATMASCIKILGKNVSEYEIAKNAYSTGRGTENWYLARYAESLGFNCKFRNVKDLSEVSAPAIISTWGHFLVLMSNQGGVYTIGDPLGDVRAYTLSDFNAKVHFTGFALTLSK